MVASPYSIDSEQRKIDPNARPEFALKPDGSPDDNNRVEIGPTALAFAEWEALGLEIPQLDSMREFRLQRLVDQLQQRDYRGEYACKEDHGAGRRGEWMEFYIERSRHTR